MSLEELDFDIAEYGGVWVSEGTKIPGINCPWCGFTIPIDEAIDDQPCDNCGKFFVVGTAKVGSRWAVTLKGDDYGPETAEIYAKNPKAARQKAKKMLGLSMDQEFDTEVERINE